MTAAVRVSIRRRSAVFCTADRDVGSGPGPLDAVVGDVRASDPAESARRALRAAGLSGDAELVRAGEPLPVSDGATERAVYASPSEAAAGGEPSGPSAAGGEWLPPTAFLARDTAPRPWESYRRGERSGRPDGTGVVGSSYISPPRCSRQI